MSSPDRFFNKEVIKFNHEEGDYLQYIHGCLDPQTKFFKYLRFISAFGELFELGVLGEKDRVLKIKNLYDEIPICLSVSCSKVTSKPSFEIGDLTLARKVEGYRL